jgi:hypothetical protein
MAGSSPVEPEQLRPGPRVIFCWPTFIGELSVESTPREPTAGRGVPASAADFTLAPPGADYKNAKKKEVRNFEQPRGGWVRQSAIAGRVGGALGGPPEIIAAAIYLAIVGAFVVVIVASCGERAEREPPEETRKHPPSAQRLKVQSLEVTDDDHVAGSISYGRLVPPVGGPP